VEVADQHLALFAAILVVDSIRSRRKCSGPEKSDTRRGLNLAASANSVRAISQWEK